MSGAPIDSQFEIIVLEGGGKDQRHVLKSTHIALGRLDAAAQPGPDRIGFPEPTVSGVHAELEWNPRKLNYTLNHLSKTNPTLVNGSQITGSRALQAGDQVKMGVLVFELRQLELPSVLAALDSNYRIVVLTGPEKGTIYKIPVGRSHLCSPRPGASGPAEVHIAGLFQSELDLQERKDGFEIQASQLSNSLKIYDTWPGMVLECPLSAETPHPVGANSLIACGLTAFVIVPENEAEMRRAQLMADKNMHPALKHLPQVTGGASFVFSLPQEHTLRFLTGPLRTNKLWLSPEELAGPIQFGKHPEAVLNLQEETAQAELTWDDNGPILKNNDPALAVALNSDELAHSQQRRLCSGDRFKLGSSTLLYEFFPIQRHVDKLAFCCDGDEVRFTRALSLIGTDTHADFFVNSDHLAAQHGRLRVEANGDVHYEHLDAGSTARVGDKVVTHGQAAILRTDQALTLAPDVEVRVVRH